MVVALDGAVDAVVLARVDLGVARTHAIERGGVGGAGRGDGGVGKVVAV